MADSLYIEYQQHFGYPPKQATHLITFAKKKDTSLSWKEATDIIKNPPTSNQSLNNYSIGDEIEFNSDPEDTDDIKSHIHQGTIVKTLHNNSQIAIKLIDGAIKLIDGTMGNYFVDEIHIKPTKIKNEKKLHKKKQQKTKPKSIENVINADNDVWSQYIKKYEYEPGNPFDLMLFTKTHSDIKTIDLSEAQHQFELHKHNYNYNNEENKENDNIWIQYKDENNGCEPENAYQLMMFTMKNNVKALSEPEATHLFQKHKKPVSKHKRTESIKRTFVRITINYNDNIYIITLDLSKKQYTIKDLTNEIIKKKYVKEPLSLLTFKLDSMYVSDFKMDIISYCKSNHKKEIIFDVENLANLGSLNQAKSAPRIIREHGVSINKLILSIKQQFNGAYFTKNKNNYNTDDEKKSNLNQGKWDKNLNEGISTLMSSQQSTMFDEIVEKFEKKIRETLDQHTELENEIKNNSNNRKIIKQELSRIMNGRKNKIDKEYEMKVKKLEEDNKKMNKLWNKTQEKTLECYNFDENIREKVDKERIKRKEYQERQIEKIENEYNDKKEKIDLFLKDQEKKLSNTGDTDLEDWYNKFEEEEVYCEKIDTLQEMVKSKIQTTNQQIAIAKYLSNSPFADNLKEQAMETDHEITKIANLAGEPLFIDMIDRDININNINNINSDHDEKKEKEEFEEKYLSFELRFDDNYNNFNENQKIHLTKEIEKLMGITGKNLQFVSSRKGCIILKFKAKIRGVIKKVKEIYKKGKNAVKDAINYKKLGNKLYNKSKEWINDVEMVVTYLKDKLGSDKVNKNAFYLATKCVAVIVSHCNKDKNSDILDCDFFDNELQKELHKVLMDPEWDRIYDINSLNYWNGSLWDGVDRGPYPYYCPVGWKKYALKFDNFASKFKGWSVCYHGSNNVAIGGILSHGIVSWGDNTYFSPSIEYCGHPYYAKPRKMKNGKYVQMVFQCRIEPTKITIKPETMLIAKEKQENIIIDPNFNNNNQLEWVLDGNGKDENGNTYYYCTGIMIRICDDPSKLKSSHWWAKYHSIDAKWRQ